jgi:hypothetical protein
VRVEPNEKPFFAVVDVIPTVSHAGPRYYPEISLAFSSNIKAPERLVQILFRYS